MILVFPKHLSNFKVCKRMKGRLKGFQNNYKHIKLLRFIIFVSVFSATIHIGYHRVCPVWISVTIWKSLRTTKTTVKTTSKMIHLLNCQMQILQQRLEIIIYNRLFLQTMILSYQVTFSILNCHFYNLVFICILFCFTQCMFSTKYKSSNDRILFT